MSELASSPMTSAQPIDRPPRRPRIAVVVPNPCDPDYRVIKQAEFLASLGYEVRIFCTQAQHLPTLEHFNGVSYQRIEWHIGKELRRLIGFQPAPPAGNREERRSSGAGLKRQYNWPFRRPIRRVARRAVNFIRSRILSFLGRRFYRSMTFKTFDSAFRKEIAAWSPDAIHAHDLVALPAAMRAAEACRIPVVFDSHELEEFRNPPLSTVERWIVRRIESRYLHRCAAVTTVSDAIADHLQTRHKISRPTLIYNCPLLGGRAIQTRWSSGTSLRSDAGLPLDAFIIVYVGNIAMNRGVEIVMGALAHLPPEIHLVTVGRASAPIREILADMQDSLGIGDRVRMLDPVGPNDVVRYISDADASVIPVLPVTLSYQYAMPNKLFESVFAGLPIVASDILEVGRFVRRHELGLLYEPFEARHCAEKIHELYRNYDGYKPSPAKIEALKKEYAWEVQEQKLSSIFSEALGRVLSP